MSGTSMATPIAAGAAAILLSADMSLTPVEVKQQLIDQSTKDTINMRDITPSSRSITPNKLVYIGKGKYLAFHSMLMAKFSLINIVISVHNILIP